jgi:hypothetical protein
MVNQERKFLLKMGHSGSLYLMLKDLVYIVPVPALATSGGATYLGLVQLVTSREVITGSTATVSLSGLAVMSF